MSNTNTILDQEEQSIEDRFIDKENDFESNESLRSSDLVSSQASESNRPHIKVKAPIPNPKAQPAAGEAAATSNTTSDPEQLGNTAERSSERMFSVAEVLAISKQIEHNLRKELAMAGFVPGANQAMSKDKAPVAEIDFSKLTMDDIYDMSIPIQAKAFGATDALKVELADNNYIARWVNKNPRRLGQFLAYGFTYVEEKDLARKLEVEVVADAQGHFVLDDVVLMRILKPKYFAALRAAHERAIRTVNSVQAANTAKDEAIKFMSKQGGQEFTELAKAGKVEFYKPGIEI